jgi:hypothetical protein
VGGQRIPQWQALHKRLLLWLADASFAKSSCPTLEGFLPAWHKLFGLGLQADSSTVENGSQRTWTAPWPGYKKKRFRRIALESTRPSHKDGAARQVSAGRTIVPEQARSAHFRKSFRTVHRSALRWPNIKLRNRINDHLKSRPEVTVWTTETLASMKRQPCHSELRKSGVAAPKLTA